MKNIVYSFSLLLCFFSFFSFGQVTELKELWPVKGKAIFQGFYKTVSGTELDYFPFLVDNSISLYLGENKKYGSIEFQTEIIPENYEEAYITFIWASGYARSAADQEKSTFKISVDNEALATFNSHHEGDPENWQYTAKNGLQLAFVTTEIDKKHGDLFGYMFLNIPAKKYKKGVPVIIKLEEISSNERDYYMAIQNPVKESVEVLAEPAILKSNQGPKQSFKVNLTYLGTPTKAQFRLDGKKILDAPVSLGENELQLLIDPVQSTYNVNLEIAISGREKINKKIQLKPVTQFEVYFLPHSHVDIGFTHRQAEVARLQWNNLDLAIDLAEKTAHYPEGSRYKWNAEISWVLDGYLEQATDKQKQRFLKAVENGSIGIDALYGSVLTGIQKEEEMFANTLFANQLIEQYGFDIQTAMITDVPGYTWGLVPGLAQTGIKYLSVGPNHMPHLPHGGYQVGHTLETWGDVPFYWVSPSGKEKILFWMSSHGYSWFHSWLMGNISQSGGEPVLKFLDELDQQKYPYSMVQLRYNIGNDNGPPDSEMPEFFKNWNEKYEWPKFKIATTMEMMKDFEKKYQDQIPEATGDFTPYWEDGVASSAAETALNRNTADKLVQAETLWALLDPRNFPKKEFDNAWKNVVIFSEHTWGANISKSDPDNEFTKDLWEVKKSFAIDANASADEMIARATAPIIESKNIEAIQVLNTSSWPRTDLVKLPAEWQMAGEKVVDEQGNAVSAQKLKTGELVFIAENIPPFGSRVYRIQKGKARPKGTVSVTGNKIQNDKIEVEIDDKTGSIRSLIVKGYDRDYIKTVDSVGFNNYWYSGLIKEKLSKNKKPIIKVKEEGPLVASLVIESEGEGANKIIQEIEVISGLEKVNILNTIDKIKVLDDENVRFSFPIDIPGGKVRIDIPWAVMEPGANQLEGANNNFYCAQRFFDVSNEEYGITIASPDVPLLEIGDMYGQFWMKDMETRPWLKEYLQSQTLFSWVMNNAWFVNYKAHQEGLISQRYILKPHEAYSDADAKRFGLEQTTPLLLIPVHKDAQSIKSPFTLDGSENIIITSFKPSADKKAWMIRMFNSGNKPENFSLNWGEKKPISVHNSSPLEEMKGVAPASLKMVPWEILTIKAHFE